MNPSTQIWFWVCLLAAGLLGSPGFAASGSASPTTASLIRELKLLAGPSVKDHQKAIQTIAFSGDKRFTQLLDDYRAGNLYVWKGRVVLSVESFQDDQLNTIAKLLDPVTRLPLKKSANANEGLQVSLDKLTSLSPGGEEFQALNDAKTVINLSDPDPVKRLSAAQDVGDGGDWKLMPRLLAQIAVEADSKVKAALVESAALLAVKNPTLADPATLLQSVKDLGRIHSLKSSQSLQALTPASDPELQKALLASIGAINRWQKLVDFTEAAFTGLSLASILILMALGLSIIFGLMGVINMAHGELMTVGAYTGFVISEVFHRWMPVAFNWYLLFAIPLAFVTAGAVGYLMEILVIRHLYGRPLETLLATWGVSLCLIQTVRLIFGDNQAVNSPSWLEGGAELVHGVVLPYNRCFIILLCVLCVIFTYAVIGRTKFGLLIRATTQNRTMASSLGVNMRRVDALTFAFGAGLAGIAGCALTLVGGITPDMGSNYIVDSFLVVVTGGVGKLAGAVWAGFGLGCLNKFLEPFVQAVWGKVLILLFVVVFIQWRPSGLFPAKGRSAND